MAKTILIIDDAASVRQVVRIALERAGYEVLEGQDGRHALTWLDGRKIHLIVSDLNMPNLDGIGFAAEARRVPAYKFTPIIMLTTEVDPAKKQAAQAAGVRAWMVKPFQPVQLLAAVAKLCLP